MLKRAQQLLCQKSKTHKNFEAKLGWALEEIIKREDPLKKAERARDSRSKAAGQADSKFNSAWAEFQKRFRSMLELSML
jgi:hypothetical protein